MIIRKIMVAVLAFGVTAGQPVAAGHFVSDVVKSSVFTCLGLGWLGSAAIVTSGLIHKTISLPEIALVACVGLGTAVLTIRDADRKIVKRNKEASEAKRSQLSFANKAGRYVLPLVLPYLVAAYRMHFYDSLNYLM